MDVIWPGLPLLGQKRHLYLLLVLAGKRSWLPSLPENALCQNVLPGRFTYSSCSSETILTVIPATVTVYFCFILSLSASHFTLAIRKPMLYNIKCSFRNLLFFNYYSIFSGEIKYFFVKKSPPCALFAKKDRKPSWKTVLKK